MGSGQDRVRVRERPREESKLGRRLKKQIGGNTWSHHIKKQCITRNEYTLQAHTHTNIEMLTDSLSHTYAAVSIIQTLSVVSSTSA